MASTVNGRAYQLATMGISATGQGAPIPIGGFQSVDYKMSAPKKPVKDSTGKVVGYTIDNDEPSGNIKFLRQDWEAFKTRLYQLNPGKGIGQIVVPVLVFTYGNSPQTLITEKVLNVMFNEDPRSAEASQEALQAAVPLFFTDVIDAQGRTFTIAE